MNKHLKQSIGLLFACALLIASLQQVVAAEFSFKVHNTTKHMIKKLLVSEDGKTYGFFDIGKGIKPDETVTLEWDKSTDKENCKQWFKAVFDDGEESEAVQFDFCEDDLTLEF
jgi:hypothetical protein